jgi:hypothetical protein
MTAVLAACAALALVVCLGGACVEPDAPLENDWTQANAARFGAKAQVRLWDGSYCDLVSDLHSIEVERAAKWKEAVGQALYYAILTDKRPAIILLTQDPAGDVRHLHRCQTVCAKHGIRLWVEKW